MANANFVSKEEFIRLARAVGIDANSSMTLNEIATAYEKVRDPMYVDQHDMRFQEALKKRQAMEKTANRLADEAFKKHGKRHVK